MKNTLIRLPKTIKVTGRSRSSIYSGIKEGTFPKPVKIGSRAIAFLESEIEEWIDSKIEKSRLKEELS